MNGIRQRLELDRRRKKKDMVMGMVIERIYEYMWTGSEQMGKNIKDNRINQVRLENGR